MALALVTFFELSPLSLLFFLSSLLPGSVWYWCGCAFSESSCAFALTSSSYFLRDFLRPPGSGLLRRSCSLFFLFEVFLSAFETQITFADRSFFFLGVEVWLGPSVFSPALGSVDSSLQG